LREEITELKDKVKEYMDKLKRVEERLEEKARVERKGEEPGKESEREEEKSVYSGGKGASSYRSVGSWNRESRLSEREVKIKKWVDRDREERKSNIIIKAVKIPKELEKD